MEEAISFSPEELENLLTPIGESGVGQDLRQDSSPSSIYYSIKGARSLARAAERALAMQGDLAEDEPNWRPVLELAPMVIAGQSKDLEIAAYLIEALVREEGFSGLLSGLKLTSGLVKSFGKALYPQPDEDGVETQLAPLAGLNGAGAEGTLIQPINNIPLTGRNSVGMFGVAAFRQASELSRLPDEQRSRRIANGAVTLEVFQSAMNDSDTNELRGTFNQIKDCLAEFEHLTKLLDDLYGHDSPPSSAIQSSLEACRDTMLTVARDRILVEAETATEDAATGGAATPGATAGQKSASGGPTPLNNREDAFREILRISSYFRNHEPHSPISYALEQIVRWGRLPLPALMKELISDSSSVSQLFKLVGISNDNDNN